MRLLMLLPLLGLASWFEGDTPPPAAPADLQLVEKLNDCLQVRLQDPEPEALGMNRMVPLSSFGRHFRPDLVTQTDFRPERDAERTVVAALEGVHIQIGFYLVGRAGTDEPSVAIYRALKGPAAVTPGTPRPTWYPGMELRVIAGDALPDWQEIYPLARKAMRSFEDGGKGFETSQGSWHIAARPVIAGQQRCVACHQSVKKDQAIGGLIYAYRRAG